MSITTQEFNSQLEEIRSRLDSQAKDRHEINGKLLTVLHHYEVKADQTADRVQKMEQAITKLTDSLSLVASSVEMIRNRLVGDSEMQTKGLTEDVNELSKRLGNLEQEHESTVKELSKFKTIAYTSISILTLVGGLIQWFQSTRVLQILK